VGISSPHNNLLSELISCSLARNNMAELFEDNQRDLERAVENLGYALEQNIGDDVGAIAKLRQEITNQSVSFSRS
jgi:hypothetical protein